MAGFTGNQETKTIGITSIAGTIENLIFRYFSDKRIIQQKSQKMRGIYLPRIIILFYCTIYNTI